MNHPDVPDAQEQSMGFIERCKQHRIPIGSFQTGSGYATIDAKCHLFHRNREKFPGPRALGVCYHPSGGFLDSERQTLHAVAPSPLCGGHRSRTIREGRSE